MNIVAFLRATLAGTVLQLGMVLAGHYSSAVSQLFPVLGITFSFVAGVLYARWAERMSAGRAALGGALAGATCAFLGIAVSYALGDVFAVLLAFGTASSAVTGALGGLAGRRFLRPGSRAASVQALPGGP